MYHIIWESLYVDKKLFEDYYTNFCQAYIRGIDAAKAEGEKKQEQKAKEKAAKKAANNKEK